MTNHVLTLLVAASLLVLNGCGTDPEPPDATLPAADGTVQIDFLNYSTGTATASASDFISVAVQVQKSTGGNNPQKLRVYETNLINTRGTQVGTTVDLRNVSDAQIKNVNYTVPASASGTVYLYFEVDESGGKFSRKLLTINVSGSGTIASYTGIVLGAQENAAASRISSATGQLYVACNAAANIGDIDITYASIGSPTALPTLLSNPERVAKQLSTAAANCGVGAPNSTAGGSATTFALAAGADFNAATDATLEALTVSGSAQSVTVITGSIVAFRRADGKKGLIRVNSFPAGTGVNGSINIDVKVQQ